MHHHAQLYVLLGNEPWASHVLRRRGKDHYKPPRIHCRNTETGGLHTPLFRFSGGQRGKALIHEPGLQESRPAISGLIPTHPECFRSSALEAAERQL